MKHPYVWQVAVVTGLIAASGPWMQLAAAGEEGFEPLFSHGSLDGWRFSHWFDIAVPPKQEGPFWEIRNGILCGLGKRTWIYSARQYGDFVLRFDIKISRGANSGIGLRFPPKGDPAYQGLEIQFVDGDVYYHSGNWHGARPEQLTGSVYDEIAARPAMKPPGQWNQMEITCRGSQITVVLNGQLVLDADLAEHTKAHQKKGPPLAERPRRGRIGFQNLSGEVQLRNVRIKTLE